MTRLADKTPVGSIKTSYITFARYRMGEAGGQSESFSLEEAEGHVAMLDHLGFENPEKHQHIEVWKVTKERIR